MDASRFFRITDTAAYESTRLAFDESRQVPAGETTYAPLAVAPRASNGDVMLAIRAAHCEMPDIAVALAAMIQNGWGSEVTESQYWTALPQPARP